jgi:polysaccharide export outer membrane protein
MGGAVIQNEVIFPGDTLQIGIVTGGAEDHAEPWELRVDENGKVDVPLVGLVPIGGLNLLEAENMIGAAGMQRRVFRKPTVRVTVSQRRVNRVTVTGAVNKPDTYELPDASSHLAAALLAAGGLSEHADHMVEIHQPAAPGLGVLEPAKMKRPTVAQSAWLGGNAPASAKPNTVMVDLVDAVETARGAHYLHDGSIVTVRRRPDRIVHLIGLTGNRAINLPPNRNVRVLDALAQAGGPQYSYWIADNVKVIRAVPRGDETVSIKVSIRGAKRNGNENILLKSGDIVSVEENVITFTLGTLGQLIGIGTTAATGAATGLVP